MTEQLDFYSQLSGDQHREIMRHAAKMEYLAKHNIPARPDLEFVGEFVRLQQCWLGWKKETLASFASVSLSTVERIERGQRVSNASLDRVALALKQKRGAFTEPRVPIVGDEAAAQMMKWLEVFEGRRWIDVAPVRQQRQIVGFGECLLCLIDGDRVEVDVRDEVAALHEWIDYLGFVRDDSLAKRSEREWRRTGRRELYKMILGHVRHIERTADAVALGGVYETETDHPYLPKAGVAVIGFFPRKTDPAAIKRRRLLVPERVEILRSIAASIDGAAKQSVAAAPSDA